MKKILSFVIAIAMVLSLVTVPALAATDAPVNAVRESGVPSMKDAATLDEALNVEGGTLVFETDVQYPWVVDGDAAKSSNEGVASSTSSVWTTVVAQPGSILTFDWISMGEGSDSTDWDGLRVYVDGTKILQKGANHPNFEQFVYELDEGEHEVKFTYKKDNSVNGNGDYAKIDNVCVSLPEPPSSIEVDPVTVPATRRATVSYTVLPVQTINKRVTFEIADTSIATVDDAGVVTGVAEGSTTITVASIVDPSVFGTATVTVTEAPPSVRLYGYSAYDISGAYTGHWISFMDFDPGVVTDEGSCSGSAYAAAFAGGTVYGYLYDSAASASSYFVMDPETMQASPNGTVVEEIVAGMGYDHSTDTMYALVGSNTRYIATVDLGTGEITSVANITGVSGTPMTFAVDGEGNGYVIGSNSSNANLYRVDLTTGAATLLGPTGFPANYVQSMTWDHNTNQLFWAQIYSVSDVALVRLDPTSGAGESLGKIGPSGHEVCGLFSIDDIETPPVVYPDAVVTFIDSVDESVIATANFPAGTILTPEDFPTPPQHEGLSFLKWDYDQEPVFGEVSIAALYFDPASIIWDFETDPWELGFEAIDQDGDGYNWQWIFGNASYSVFEGSGIALSSSYENTVGALTPDNWLITPEFIGESFSFYMAGQDPSYVAEYVGVYVSTDGGETWSEEIAAYTATASFEEKVIDLADYVDTPIRVALRHYNCTDMYKLNVDFMTVTGVKYVVTFIDTITLEVIDEVIVPGGESVTPPEAPEHFGYEFVEWDTLLDEVTCNLTVNAIYKPLWDSDDDGDVDTADALAVMRHVMSIEECDLETMDADGDGEVTIADALIIMRFAMGLLD